MILKVNNLKTYFFTQAGVVKAVDGVTFAIKENEVLGLVGESGCGKTVTALSIMRLVDEPGRIVEGEVLLSGENLLGLDSDGMRRIRGRRVSMVFQEPMTSLNPVMRIGEQIQEAILAHTNQFPRPVPQLCSGWFTRDGEHRRTKGRDLSEIDTERPSFIRDLKSAVFTSPLLSILRSVLSKTKERSRMYKSKKEAKEISVKLLRQMHIPDSERIFNEYPHTLSGGTRQRIMLAMALALNPQLLILDEPTTALDVTIQAGILDLLNEIRRSFRTSMIFITHDFGIIAELADIVAVMYAGKIVEQAEAHEIFYNPKHPYTKGLLNSVPRCSEKKDLLLGIEGNVPDLLNLPTGCSFNPRCELACGVCYKKEPELLELAAGHLARCWMAK